jgi:hypothetical protein
LYGGPGGGTPSIDDLFRYATHTGRFGITPIETKGRPDDSSRIFRSKDDSPVDIAASLLDGDGSVTSELATAQQPQFFGFAWRGLSSNETSPLIFDLVKIIEWRPEPTSGLMSVPNRAMHITDQTTKATRHLDRTVPNWATTAWNVATSKQAMNLYKSGFQYGVQRLGSSGAVNDMISYELPRMLTLL